MAELKASDLADLSIAHGLAGRYEDAYKACAEGIKLAKNPTAFDYFVLGNFAVKAKLPNEAKRAFKKAIEMFPEIRGRLNNIPPEYLPE